MSYEGTCRTLHEQTHKLCELGYGIGLRVAKGRRAPGPMKPPQYGVSVNSVLSMWPLTQREHGLGILQENALNLQD